MVIAIDFDGTLVSETHKYEDLDTPLQLLPWAKEALEALKRAGHLLVLVSARANLSLRVDPMLDPLTKAGVRRFDPRRWKASKVLNEARYEQMLAFVELELPGLFDAIDDGQSGKMRADLFIDDRGLRYSRGGGLAADWPTIVSMYGEPSYQVIRGNA